MRAGLLALAAATFIRATARAEDWGAWQAMGDCELRNERVPIEVSVAAPGCPGAIRFRLRVAPQGGGAPAVSLSMIRILEGAPTGPGRSVELEVEAVAGADDPAAAARPASCRLRRAVSLPPAGECRATRTSTPERTSEEDGDAPSEHEKALAALTGSTEPLLDSHAPPSDGEAARRAAAFRERLSGIADRSARDPAENPTPRASYGGLTVTGAAPGYRPAGDAEMEQARARVAETVYRATGSVPPALASALPANARSHASASSAQGRPRKVSPSTPQTGASSVAPRDGAQPKAAPATREDSATPPSRAPSAPGSASRGSESQQGNSATPGAGGGDADSRRNDYLECIGTNHNCEYGTSAACNPNNPLHGEYGETVLWSAALMTAKSCSESNPWRRCWEAMKFRLPPDEVKAAARSLEKLLERRFALPSKWAGQCSIPPLLNPEELRQTRFWCSNGRKDCYSQLELAIKIAENAFALDDCVGWAEFRVERERIAKARIDQCAQWAGWSPPSGEIEQHMRSPPPPPHPSKGPPRWPPPAPR